jgi:hypothetical protein
MDRGRGVSLQGRIHTPSSSSMPIDDTRPPSARASAAAGQSRDHDAVGSAWRGHFHTRRSPLPHTECAESGAPPQWLLQRCGPGSRAAATTRVHPLPLLALGLDLQEQVVDPGPGPAAGEVPGLEGALRKRTVQAAILY